MADTSLSPAVSPPRFALDTSAPLVVAVMLGIVMPVAAAILFPTYMHQMPSPAWEWIRLLELPFVLFEVGVILWAGRRQIDREALWNRLPRDVKWAFVPLFTGVLVGSLFLSNNPAGSMTMALMTVIHVLFALAIYHLFVADRCKGSQSFLTWHAYGLVVLAMYTAWWFSFPPPAEEVMGGVIKWRSALPGFISVRHFGAWTGAIAAGFAVQILFVRPRSGWTFDHLFYFLAAAMTVWSGTRAAVLAITVVVPLFVLFRREFPPFPAIAKAALLTGLAMGAAWLLRWDADSAFLLFADGDFSSLDAASSRRNLLWAKAFELWTQSPLFGWGTGSFFWEGKPWSHTQPHNVVLQFLVSWGLVGALGGLWLVVRGIQFTHRAAMQHVPSLALLGMMYGLLFQSLLEGMLHYPRFIASIIALGALVLAQAHLQPVSSTRD